MSRITYVLLNGPPECGKSTVARELTKLLPNAIQDSLAAPMKHFIATALGEKYAEMDKAKMRPELNGDSVRAFLIQLAESYLREIYGRDIFVRWLMHRVLRYPEFKPQFVIIDDLGFVEEYEMLKPKTYLVHVVRDGKDFKNDSRSYIKGSDAILMNNDSVEKLYERVGHLARSIEASA